ncbi:hypothetical protein T492DRAFT_862935 [Pavlovales sp. CCMP2436]|nr:hypothetical protein T492DRAFT_862935 [Pavlovales sp. CCMP2436]
MSRFTDRLRTTVNVLGDAVVCAAVDGLVERAEPSRRGRGGCARTGRHMLALPLKQASKLELDRALHRFVSLNYSEEMVHPLTPIALSARSRAVNLSAHLPFARARAYVSSRLQVADKHRAHLDEVHELRAKAEKAPVLSEKNAPSQRETLIKYHALIHSMASRFGESAEKRGKTTCIPARSLPA